MNSVPPLADLVCGNWRSTMEAEFAKGYWMDLQDFVAREREKYVVYPPLIKTFSAFDLTPPQDVRVVLLGQDPYHSAGQANGLSFSVGNGSAIPPSLRNIYKELHSDLGILPSKSGDLSSWARQGVLLLNTTLTVRDGCANSHFGKGWETFTAALIEKLGARSTKIVFVLWGAAARRNKPLIDNSVHAIIESAHPSPLSAHRGFLGSKPFSKINNALVGWDMTPIDWRIATT